MAGNYLKSLQLAKQLEERAKEATRNRELAEKEFEALKQFIQSCEEADADLSEVEKPKQEFEAAIATKDYQSALGHVRKAMEAAKSAYVKKIGDVADSAEALINLTQSSGKDSKAALDLLEKSKDRVVKDDMETAMKLAKNAYDAAERLLHEVFSELFSQAQETIMQAKDLGEDVAMFDDQLTRAKSALENQEYEACMSQIKEVLESAGEELKAQIKTTLSTAEERVSVGDDLGADMTKVKNHIERASGHLEAMKYRDALAYAKRAAGEGENIISARSQDKLRELRESIKKIKGAGEDVTVAQELFDQAQAALKEKQYIELVHALNSAHTRVHQTEFQSVLDVISQARDRFVLAKKVGVDMTKSITLLNTARDNLKLGKFEAAIKYAEQSRSEVDEALEMFYKARDSLVELAKAAKFAADMGVDPGASKNLLGEARKHFESKDYDATVQATGRGIEEVRKLAKTKASEGIEKADNAVKLGKGMGADVTEAEGILQRALEYSAKDEFMECVNLAKSSLDASNAAMTRLASDRIQSLDQFVRGYSGEDDVEDLVETITLARQHIASYDFEKANELIKTVMGKIEAIGAEECDRQLAAARAKMEGIREMDGSTDDLEILMTRAYDALERKAYDDATARAREVLQQSDEVMTRLLQAELSAVKDTLEQARAIGIDISPARESLRNAAAKAGTQEFVDAFRIVRDTKESLNSGISRHDGVREKIARTQELIDEASKTKADFTGVLDKLETAKQLFSQGDLEGSDKILDDAMGEAEKNLGMYLAAKYILSSKETIDVAEANGIDVEPAAQLLAKAKEQMKLKTYDEALATAKMSDGEGKRLTGAAIVDMIKSLQRLLTDARNVGVDTTGPERLADKALELSKTGSFVEALRCIASAKEDINHVKSLSSQAAVEIRAARTNLKDAETLDMDVGKARELLEQSIEALTKHQYAIALELARKSSGMSNEVTKSRIWDTLERFKGQVEEAANKGMSLGMAERCVAEGIEAFKQGKYQDSLKLAMTCEAEMERVELQRDISARAVEMSKVKLQEAASDGIKIDRLEKLVSKAESLFKAGKYVESLTASIESGDELHSIHENLDACKIEMSATRERIERLRKLGIDTSECDEAYEIAEENLEDQDFEKCRDALRRASETAAQLFEGSIEEILSQNAQMISKAKAMGINTKGSEDLLDVAKTSFNEKLWDFAYQQALACKNSCLELIAAKITNLVEEVRGRMSELSRMGASTTVLEAVIDDARAAGAEGNVERAFQILMDADSKIAAVEDSHRKYVDISIAAESAIENLGRYGLSKREPERLMAMAEIEKDKDYDSAIELVAEALDTAKNLMEAYSPDISGSVSSTGLQDGVKGVISVMVVNSGKAVAKDAAIEVGGDFEQVEPKVVPLLKPNDPQVVELDVIPKKSGSVPVKISITSRRPLDGSIVSAEIEDSLNVFPKGPAFKIGRSTEIARCISCQGRIKPGFDVVTCRCGGKLHLSCAQRGGKCPICGQGYDF